ncbi:hypothetical protein ACSYAD_28415 [Acaryochloris marina NIES-2412]|uniref:hypothetical protein n=1 Tax=Acaryochloris marina TaxID=155978 RepID=UPI004057E7BB
MLTHPKPLLDKLCEVTGYTLLDLAGFAKDEGYPIRPILLSPFQKIQLRNIVLCHWSIKEGYFTSCVRAEVEFIRLWGKVKETDLIWAWIDYCQDRELISKGMVY